MIKFQHEIGAQNQRFQSAIPQHQKGIELGPVSDSGIASISNCGSFSSATQKEF